MSKATPERVDFLLIGAGIMSATVGTLLKELDPSANILVLEALEDCAMESSNGWNNAGTGHAANCELNYTPQQSDGSVDISRALEVNVEFDLSRQFWSYLVEKGIIDDPADFIRSCPHMSFVWGEENVKFLQARYEAMSAHHCYHGMQFSTDPKEIAAWAPLIIEGREDSTPVAATRMITGTDVDYGTLTRILFEHLKNASGVNVQYLHTVTDLKRDAQSNEWIVTARCSMTHEKRHFQTPFVFIGAGGGSLELLEKSNIPEGHGYGGFPVGGIWLRCDDEEVSHQHNAKVYGMAPTGSPPMSVPHLDTRIVEGKRSVLFGPYAGFSTRFLKHGSLTDLFRSVRVDNVVPMLDVAKDNMDLTEYLISQVLQSGAHQFEMLTQFYPRARRPQWQEVVAGQRVQIIRPTHKHHGGRLEFGTELISASDQSLAALLGASPGASTAAFIAIELLERCFADRLTADGWLNTLRQIFPTYGIDLKTDADACRSIRAKTAQVLKLDNI